MFKINENYGKLKANYLFATTAKRGAEYMAAHKDADLIRLGIGDVTRPLAGAVVEAMKKAADEMGEAKSFRGYGPDRGYEFLLEKIIENEFLTRGVSLSTEEIFLSDGAKSDTANIGDILGRDNVIAVCDPVYPVYVDTNVMAGRCGEINGQGYYDGIVYLPCTPENNFAPRPTKDLRADVIYLCYPNNPTGAVATKEDLTAWVNYANENKALILFDAAYEAFITEDVPHSIYEIEGAKNCAIEFRSFSKKAGFTGTRCAFTVVPKELKCGDVSLNALWSRRVATKFNGVSYVVQRGAEAVYSKAGKIETQSSIDYYLNNAKVISDGLTKGGYTCYGGKSAPYIWVKTPDGLSSWQFFDYLLNEKQILSTPGVGFGPCGEGFIRLTAFNTLENSLRAVERILK